MTRADPCAGCSACCRRTAAGSRPASALGFLAIAANVALVATSAYLVSKAAMVTNVAEIALAITAVRVLAIGRAAFRYLERYATHRRDAAHPRRPAGLVLRRDRAARAGPADDPPQRRPAGPDRRPTSRRSRTSTIRVVVPPIVAALVDRVRLPAAGRVRSAARRRPAGVPRAGRGGPAAADATAVARGVGRARRPGGASSPRSRSTRSRGWPTSPRSTRPTATGRRCSPKAPASTGSASGLPPFRGLGAALAVLADEPVCRGRARAGRPARRSAAASTASSSRSCRSPRSPRSRPSSRCRCRCSCSARARPRPAGCSSSSTLRPRSPTRRARWPLPSGSPPSLELRGLTFAYEPGGRHVLDDVDLTVPAGA